MAVSGRILPTFRREILSPSTGSNSMPTSNRHTLLAVCFLLVLRPWNGRSTVLQKVEKLLPDSSIPRSHSSFLLIYFMPRVKLLLCQVSRKEPCLVAWITFNNADCIFPVCRDLMETVRPCTTSGDTCQGIIIGLKQFKSFLYFRD
jgi:hypothetical protein